MKTNSILALMTFILLSGCSDKDSTVYTASIENTTQHSIKILPYRSGTVNFKDTVQLNGGEKIMIADGQERGLRYTPGFNSNLFAGAVDSIIVMYDNIYRVSHYVNLPPTTSPKYYPYTSPRNILNSGSYQLQAKKLNSHLVQLTHLYQFTEQDYLDAR